MKKSRKQIKAIDKTVTELRAALMNSNTWGIRAECGKTTAFGIGIFSQSAPNGTMTITIEIDGGVRDIEQSFSGLLEAASES
jgi:hypothetical protein